MNPLTVLTWIGVVVAAVIAIAIATLVVNAVAVEVRKSRTPAGKADRSTPILKATDTTKGPGGRA